MRYIDLQCSSIGSLTNPNKYYCEDQGLRNARIGFRQQEMTHIIGPGGRG